MARAVGTPGDDERYHGRDDKDRYAADLSRFCGEAKIFDDGWGEEAGGVAGVHNPDVHDDAAVDLPIAKDSLSCRAVEAVHFGVGDVGA